MRRWCFSLLAVLLFLVGQPQPSLAASGQWQTDDFTACKAYVPAHGRGILYHGRCRNGYANGMGRVELSLKPRGKEGYTAFFVNGYPFTDVDLARKTDVIFMGDNIALTSLPHDAELVSYYYAVLDSDGYSTDPCSGQAYAIISQSEMDESLQENLMRSFRDRYRQACPQASASQAVSLKVLSYEVASQQKLTPLLATVEVPLQGAAAAAATPPAMIAEPTAALNLPESTGQEPLKISAFLSYSDLLGSPLCRLNIRLLNSTTTPLQEIDLQGTILDQQGQPLGTLQKNHGRLPGYGSVTLGEWQQLNRCQDIGGVQLRSLTCKASATQERRSCIPLVGHVKDHNSIGPQVKALRSLSVSQAP